MDKLKNIALFFLPLLVFTLLTLLFIQRQQFKRAKLLHEIKVRVDSTNMEQFYKYVLGYGDCISVPLKKEMLVSDSNNKYIKIGQLINKTKYIYHFDETNCFTCVENYIPFLQKLSKKVGKGNVIILGSYEKSGNLFLTLRGYNLKDIPIYNLNPAYLRDTKIDELNTPYIFETDSLLHSKRFYIPEKALPDLSKLYYKNILSNN